MPNTELAVDTDSPIFAARLEAARKGRASVSAARDEIRKQLASIFFAAVTRAILRVTTIKDDDIDLEVREFGYRITGQGGVLLPVNLLIRALNKPKWQGNWREAIGDEPPVTKADVVARITSELVVQALANIPGWDKLGFDVKVENAPGSYDTGERARKRIVSQQSELSGYGG